MTLQGTVRQVGEVVIVDFSGKITLGEGSSMLRRTLYDLIGSGKRKIILNLYDVDYIDSSGIGELVSGYTTVRGAQGELKLLNLTKRIKDLLQITRLYTVFDVRSDEDEAIASFSSP